MFRRPSLEETTEWFWQLKSRSGGEKNFCFFQISNSLKRGVAERWTAALPLRPGVCQGPSNSSRPAAGTPPRGRTTIQLGWMLFFRNTIADCDRISHTAWPTCPPSCSNTPEKLLQNVKYCACAAPRRVQRLNGGNTSMSQGARAPACSWF